MSGTGAASAPSASIKTDPETARRVIAQSRLAFDARYPDLKLSPAVGLICAYEEEANIGAVLAAMPVEACGLAVSTLVVVDGGGDRTDQVSLDSGAITFVLTENLGHGYALRVGYALCVELGAQFVVTLDADGQNDPAEIPVMLQPLVDDEADFVVASRRLGQDTTTDRFRKVGVRVFSAVMSAMGGTKLTDTSNGYRALRAAMLEDVVHKLTQSQYQTAELLIVCMKRGWRVTERPTVWLPRASGTTKKGKNYLFGFRYGRVVLATWWRERREVAHP
ncbi:MAG TPA: glycosyltransferase family 2 protein [Acidimicrobiales bacterium]|nr:glycosyltransferase family 2 protein [Acidimicrobiales bacterium]